MRHGSLFSGIGGFDLAAEWMGWENVFHCEWNPFGQRVLKHYWPNAKSYEDITQTDFTIHRRSIDILTGGFPCQPYSMAGKRKGKEDERHLWPEMLRAIREIAPRYIVGENVLGLVNWDGGMVFDEVQADLESAGYEVAAVVIPAAAVNAPHGRDRVWFVAYSKCNANGLPSERRMGMAGELLERCQWEETTNRLNNNGENGLTADTESQQSERLRPEQREFSESQQREFGRNCGEMGYRLAADSSSSECKRRKQHRSTGKTRKAETNRRQFSRPICPAWTQFPTQSPICGGNDGLPSELDGITFSKWRNESIKAYGNAIVPQVAFEIFKVIQSIETQS